MLNFDFMSALSELEALREEYDDLWYMVGFEDYVSSLEQKISALESEVAQYLAESAWLDSLEHYYIKGV